MGENGRIAVTEDNGEDYFRLIPLIAGAPLDRFECRIPEYTAYLREEGL